VAEVVDYSKLSFEELLDEVRLETETLATKQADLAVYQKRKLDIERAITEERLLPLPERYARRAELIATLEKSIGERQAQISRTEEDIRRRTERISELQKRIGAEEARLLIPTISPVERLLIRETAASLRRSLARLEGWQTRKRDWLSALRRVQATERRSLGQLRRQQVKEEPLLIRLTQLRIALSDITTEITRLQTEIAIEQARLQEKRKYLPKWFKGHVIVSVLYEEDKMFETHMIFPSLTATIGEDDPFQKILLTLAYELMLDYAAESGLEKMLHDRKTKFAWGEVQIKPVKAFNEKTTGAIIDMWKERRERPRATYEITWKHTSAYTETTLEGKRIEHPASITYTKYERLSTLITAATLKEMYNQLVKEEQK